VIRSLSQKILRASLYPEFILNPVIISNYILKTHHAEGFIYVIMLIYMYVFKHFLRASVVKALQTKNPDCHGISALIFQKPIEVCGVQTDPYISVELFCLIYLRQLHWLKDHTCFPASGLLAVLQVTVGVSEKLVTFFLRVAYSAQQKCNFAQTYCFPLQGRI
jgi:hypothetical protein